VTIGSYDPDRMQFEDVDPTDLDALTEWFEHPVTQALHEDLSRQPDQRLAAARRRDLVAQLDVLEALQSRSIAELPPSSASAEARAAYALLLRRIEDAIIAIRSKLREIDNS
jgi:hypothetical protein